MVSARERESARMRARDVTLKTVDMETPFCLVYGTDQVQKGQVRKLRGPQTLVSKFVLLCDLPVSFIRSSTLKRIIFYASNIQIIRDTFFFFWHFSDTPPPPV